MHVAKLFSIIFYLAGGAAYSDTVILECLMKDQYSNIGPQLLSHEGHHWRVVQVSNGFNIQIRYANGDWSTGRLYSLSQPPSFLVFSLQFDKEDELVEEIFQHYYVFTVHKPSGTASFTTHEFSSSMYQGQRGAKQYSAAVTLGRCTRPE